MGLLGALKGAVSGIAGGATKAAGGLGSVAGGLTAAGGGLAGGLAKTAATGSGMLGAAKSAMGPAMRKKARGVVGGRGFGGKR